MPNDGHAVRRDVLFLRFTLHGGGGGWRSPNLSNWIPSPNILLLGKNDGSVKGVRYFSCPEKRGVFVRPDKVQLDKRGRAIRSPRGNADENNAVVGHAEGRKTGKGGFALSYSAKRVDP